MNSAIRSAVFYNSAAKRPHHYHDCHQILFVTRGSALVLVNGEESLLAAGSILITSRFESHSVGEMSDDYERFVLRIDPRAVTVDKNDNRIFSLLFNRPQGFCRVIDISDEKNFFLELFGRITAERASEKELGAQLLDAYLSELLILLYRRLPEGMSGMYEENFEIISDIQHRFERDYQKSFSLKLLAKEYSISVSYLSHRFKLSTGVSVMEYLLDCRLAAAKKKLASTDMSIGEIVESCGFCDNSNFTRTFRRKTGLTPSQFRKKYRRARP